MMQKSVFKSEAGKQAVIAVYDTILQNWPVPYETMEIDTRHGRTFVVACGAAQSPPLFLIHGSGSNAAMWIGDAAEYSRYFRVYAMDIPGEAGRSCDVRPNLKAGAHAQWLYDVYTALGIKKASIVGISLGGWIAGKFAAAFPEMVDKLVLLCPAGIGPQRLSSALSAIPMLLLGKRGAEKAMRKIFKSSDIPEQAVAYSRLISENFRHYRGAIPYISDAELARLTMPVLFIGGEMDALLDMGKAAERAKRQIPSVTAVLLQGAGHVLADQQNRILPFVLA